MLSVSGDSVQREEVWPTEAHYGLPVLIAGGGMAAAYFALNCNNRHCHRFTSSTSLKWYGLTTVGCFALSPIVGGALVSLNERRELRSSEVAMMLGDCLLPIIGGLIVKAAYDANPQWDAGTGRARPWPIRIRSRRRRPARERGSRRTRGGS